MFIMMLYEDLGEVEYFHFNKSYMFFSILFPEFSSNYNTLK